MAITLKDQSSKKDSFKIDEIAKKLILVLVILLFAAGIIFLYQRIIFASTENIKAEIKAINEKRDTNLEKEMKEVTGNFNKARTLLNNHKNATGVFVFLQQNTYQGVTLSNFQANLKENTLSFNISSSVPQNLAVQIAVFKAAKWKEEQAVSNVEVGGFSIGDQGAITLNIKLTLGSAITKF